MPDRFWMALAGRLPLRLAYWAAIRVTAYATTGRYGDTVVPELTVLEALSRWARDHQLGSAELVEAEAAADG